MTFLRRHRLSASLRSLAAIIIAWIILASIVVMLTDAIGDGRVW